MTKRQAKLLIQQGQIIEAQPLLEKICSKNPSDGESYYLLGIINGQLGNYEEAVDLLQRAANIQPRAIAARYALGMGLKELGRFKEAEQALREALSLRANAPEALLELGNVLFMQDKPSEAEDCFKRVLQATPNSAAAFHGLGIIYQKRNQIDEAARFFNKALKIAPDLAETRNNLAYALRRTGRLDESISHLERVIAENPGFLQAHDNLGLALKDAGKLVEASIAFDNALKIDPEDLIAILGKAEVLERRGEYGAAYALLAPFLHKGEFNPNIAIVYTNISYHIELSRDAIAYANKVIDDDRTEVFVMETLHFALGKLHDRLGEYQLAFSHYERANDLTPDRYDAGREAALTDALIEIYSEAFMAAAPRSEISSNRPIFIVGMPRSGTSLTEQILASHPDIYGAGELTNIQDLINLLPALVGPNPPFPYNLEKVTADILSKLSRRYLDSLAELDAAAVRVTDKTPQNFRYLGLIALLFPNSRVIHCVRDPRDTCLSIYFQQFYEFHTYANNLENVTHYYNEYKRLMQCYEKVLNIPMLRVAYEDLVANQEAISRTMVEFAGMPWDERCLAFHETDRYVATSSYDQTRRPIYSDSVGRWKNYAAQVKGYLPP